MEAEPFSDSLQPASGVASASGALDSVGGSQLTCDPTKQFGGLSGLSVWSADGRRFSR